MDVIRFQADANSAFKEIWQFKIVHKLYFDFLMENHNSEN